MEGGGGGGSGRWKLTVSDQMSVIDTSILRDFMRVREDDDNCQDSIRGLTLGAILGCEKRPATIPVSRTLLDIMRDEEPGSPCTGLAGENNKKNWKSFKDRIRLRRASTTWSASSSTHISLDDIRIQTSHPPPSPSVAANSVHILSTTTPAASAESILALNQPEIVSDNRGNIVTEYDAAAPTEPVVTRLAAALAAERELQRPGRESEGDGLNSAAVAEEGREVSAASTEAAAEVAPVRMSLMELLEETDRQAGVVGSGLLGTAVEEGEEGKEGGQEGGEYVCCVCMVRHKGAAFIPCGHTFCRLCCRELWVSRGNCPLCNGFILEILDIF